MITVLMLVLTYAYFGAAVYHWATGLVPMAVFLWGGLILILGWYGHDRIQLWREGVV